MDPENGGTVEAVRGMAEAQAKRGHAVTVVSTGCTSDTSGAARGARWIVFPLMTRTWRWSPALAASIAGLVRENDIVHLHTMWDFPVREGARACRALRKSYVISPHGMLEKWSLGQRAVKKSAYLALTGGRILRHAEAVHFTSAGEYRNSTAVIDARKAFICHLGVDSALAGDTDTKAFQRSFPALEGKRFILFLGRLHPQKRPELILESFARIADRFQGVLAFAGPGPESYVKKLRRQAGRLNLSDRVVFTGMLSRGQVAAALRLAQTLVLVSFRESFGLSVVEAMAASRAVIVSPGVHLSDEIRAVSAGIVAEPDERSLSEAMERILSDDALRRRMGENGRELVANRFQWPPSAECMIQIYEDVLNRRRTSPAWVER